MEAHAISPDKPFAMARARFEAFVEELGGEHAQNMPHTELERRVGEEGREILRQLCQDHLDLRAQGTPHEAVVGEDGRVRVQARMRDRKLSLIFGEVEVEREGYTANGLTSRFPLDAELNLPREKYSLGLRKLIAEEAARGSFDDAVDAVRRHTGVEVPKRQAEELVERAAVDFDAFYAQREVPHGAATQDVLVVTTDGKGVVMRKEALREQTRRCQERETATTRRREYEHKDPKSRGRPHKRRQAMVAGVYTVAPWVRTADDIVGELRGKERVHKRPRPEHKRVWASVEKDSYEVVGEAFAEAEQRDPGHEKRWAALVDGDESQMDMVLEQVGRTNPKTQVVLDLLHVLLYLWAATKALCRNDDEATEQEVTQRLRMLLEGKVFLVAAALRRSATRRQLSRKAREPVEKAARYFVKYAPFMRYDEYLAAGLPIATGVIEGACRHLVKDRMELTGARWGLAGAEAILKLRALRSSGDLPAYWAFHEQQEFQRNHASRYAHGPPALVHPAFSRAKRPRPSLRLVK